MLTFMDSVTLVSIIRLDALIVFANTTNLTCKCRSPPRWFRRHTPDRCI